MRGVYAVNEFVTDGAGRHFLGMLKDRIAAERRGTVPPEAMRNVAFLPLMTSLCVAHTLNLVFKSIVDIPDVQAIVDRVVRVAKLLRDVEKPKTLYRKQLEKDKEARKLQVPGETRFGSVYMVISKMLASRNALAATMVSKEWTDWQDAATTSFRDRAEAVRTDVVGGGADINLWRALEALKKILFPVYTAIKVFDAQGARLSEFYHYFKGIRVAMRRANMSRLAPAHRVGAIREAILQKLQERLDYIVKFMPDALVAYAMDPLYLCEKPQKDVLVNTAVDGFLVQVPDGVSANLYAELARFWSKEGSWNVRLGAAFHKDDDGRRTLDPCVWWNMVASYFETLAPVARRFLAMTGSVCECERIWKDVTLVMASNRASMEKERAMRFSMIPSLVRGGHSTARRARRSRAGAAAFAALTTAAESDDDSGDEDLLDTAVGVHSFLQDGDADDDDSDDSREAAGVDLMEASVDGDGDGGGDLPDPASVTGAGRVQDEPGAAGRPDRDVIAVAGVHDPPRDGAEDTSELQGTLDVDAYLADVDC